MDRIRLEHQLDHFSELSAVMGREGLVRGLTDFFEKKLHILALEGRKQGCHLIQNAANGPDVTLKVIRHVSPHFRARIVRCACLCANKPFLDVDHLRDIKVSQFALVVLVDQNVRTLDVPVHDVQVMERLQARKRLDKHAPDLLLLKAGASPIVLVNHPQNVSLFSVLHNHAKCVALEVKE